MSDWGIEQQGQWLQTWVTEGQNNRVNDINTTDMSDWGTEQQGQWHKYYRHEWLRDRTTGSMT
jgi:hypothetical protein